MDNEKVERKCGNIKIQKGNAKKYVRVTRSTLQGAEQIIIMMIFSVNAEQHFTLVLYFQGFLNILSKMYIFYNSDFTELMNFF